MKFCRFEGPNLREPKSINRNRNKGKIEDELDGLLKGEMQSSMNKTGKSLPPLELVIVSKNDQNILSLKTIIKHLNEI